MPEYYPQPRQLPAGPMHPDGGYDHPAGDAVSLGQLFRVIRRRYKLILLVTLVGLGAGAFLAAKTPASYRAMATIRLANERRTLTEQFEEQPSENISPRTMDPILSLAQGARSYSVLGAVVDSLGLQLNSDTPEFGIAKLDKVWVNPQTANDTIQVTFYQNGVKAQLRNRETRARYGEVLDLGSVRFAVRAVPDVPSAMLHTIPHQMAADNLFNNLQVIPRAGTDVIDVSYISPNPRMAENIVNTTVKVFKQLSIDNAKQMSTRRRQFLEGQLKQTDSMLARSQAELAAFRSREQLASTQAALDRQQTDMMTLDERRVELEADRQTFGTLMDQLKKGGDSAESEGLRALAASPAMAENPKVSDLFHQLEVNQYKLDSMTTGPWRAAPTNPDLIQLKALIASTKSQLRQAVSSHVATLDSRIGALRKLRTQQGSALQLLPAMAEEEARLTGRVQTLQSTSDEVRKDYQKARMAEEVEAGDLDIVDLSGTPYAAIWETAPLKLALGLLLGLMLGIGGAFLLEALNTSIRKPEDLEVALHVPGLAVIPRLSSGTSPAAGRRLLRPGKRAELDKRANASTLGTVTQPFSIGVEAFRMLRTSLVWCEQGDSMKTLVVTSAAPGEGKTLTSANLSVTFAYDGLRVLLVDCDVRRPRLHGLFQVPRSPGLMELLTPSYNGNDASQSLTFNPTEGRTDSGRPVTDVVRPTNVRGLSLLTCGALPTNPSGLLSGVRMRVLLQELAKSFDLVILDTPPVLATADAGILGSLADGVLLVVRAGQTDRIAAKRAHQQLVNVGARVVGTVLNDPGGEVSQYGDYYYPYDYAVEEQ
jgi:polysaccharide biosynthesis transport protein